MAQDLSKRRFLFYFTMVNRRNENDWNVKRVPDSREFDQATITLGSALIQRHECDKEWLPFDDVPWKIDQS